MIIKYLRILPRTGTRLLFKFQTASSSKFHTSTIQFINQNETLRKFGEQNKFYFEPSTLLPNSTDHPDYAYLNKHIPIVIILGWTGAKDQNLIKYSRIYNSLGFHTIRFSPSTMMTFFYTKEHKKHHEELLHLLGNQYGLTENKIFVHMFSNAGYFIIYQYIFDICNSKYIPLNSSSMPVEDMKFFCKNQVGVIYDSGLGMVTPFRKLRAGLAELAGGKGLSSIFGYCFGIFGACLVSLYKLRNNPDEYFSKGFSRYPKEEKCLLPTLHIYSKKDALISSEDIEKLIEERKRRHPSLYLKQAVFEDASHVLIYKKHPEIYEELIREHLCVCGLDPKKLDELKSKRTNEE